MTGNMWGAFDAAMDLIGVQKLLRIGIAPPLLFLISLETVHHVKLWCGCILGGYLQEEGEGSASRYALGVGLEANAGCSATKRAFTLYLFISCIQSQITWGRCTVYFMWCIFGDLLYW